MFNLCPRTKRVINALLNSSVIREDLGQISGKSDAESKQLVVEIELARVA